MKNQPNFDGIRKMSDHEAAAAEAAWQASPEKRALDERRRKLDEDIGTRMASYSKRA
jgi:hypothetical protein